MSKKLYIVVKNYRGYDDYYVPLDKKDKTWKSTLEIIESALDDKFLDNDDKLDGISLEVKIVLCDPTELEFEENT